MEEVFRAGPVAAAMDTPGQIFSYSDGVFDTRPAKHTRTCEDNLGGLNGWEYTNHAIAIVGWGEKQVRERTVVRNTGRLNILHVLGFIGFRRPAEEILGREEQLGAELGKERIYDVRSRKKSSRH
eukprot:GHVU01138220.1.p2 GENE.GHVU01138220.1~~GHVU01138220.1.p2  ORF type:complete len:125 (-),score=11.30 GHVU01138220.1:372-746(-)